MSVCIYIYIYIYIYTHTHIYTSTCTYTIFYNFFTSPAGLYIGEWLGSMKTISVSSTSDSVLNNLNKDLGRQNVIISSIVDWQLLVKK